MTPSQCQRLYQLIARLYPSSDWTEEVFGVLTARLSRTDLSDEQAAAVVSEYKATERMHTRSPSVPDLLSRLKAASRVPSGQVRPGVVQPERDDPGASYRPLFNGWMRDALSRVRAGDANLIERLKRLPIRGVPGADNGLEYLEQRAAEIA